MSIKFNQTSTLDGLIQLFEAEIGVEYGYISGSTERMKEVTALINLAKRRYFSIAVQAGGTWEVDDNTNADYAIVYTDIVSGQRDYALLTDATGNAILDIYKVLILPTATATRYQELDPIDENQSENLAFIDESNVAGTPTSYGKRANAIFLGGAIPNYNATNGLKVLVNREPLFYSTTDTIKLPGFPYYPEYFFLEPAFRYARRKKKAIAVDLEKEVLKLEGVPENGIVGLIAKAYGDRKKDEDDVISGECINSI